MLFFSSFLISLLWFLLLGWNRVNDGFGWEELLTDFDIPRATGNGAQALKLIYARHLWPYEKHKRGEDLDEDFKEVECKFERQDAMNEKFTMLISIIVQCTCT